MNSVHQSPDHPALAPSSGAAAAELQAQSESQSGSSAHPAPAPSGAAAAELQAPPPPSDPFNPVDDAEVPEETGVPLQPMERFLLSALGVSGFSPLAPLASNPGGHKQPQSPDHPALAPSSGATAAELQAQSESG